ncbi:MAG: hypothetical protein ABJC89_23730, partial [Acidobacteriota bacterium]
MFVVAAALFGLVALLATVQYRWLGQISDAERERMSAALNSRASAFAHDLDSELARAYLQFQVEPSLGGDPAPYVGARYDRWQATARYPRMIKEAYLAPGAEGAPVLQRFDSATRLLESVEWPAALQPVRDQLI